MQTLPNPPLAVSRASDWRIHMLQKLGVLQRKGRGWYSFEKGTLYEPDITRSTKRLCQKIHKQFPYLDICLWNSKSLNEFMIHQPGRFYQFVETDKDATEPVFYFLKEQKENVFLNPSDEILVRYAFDKQEIIIVNQLITEAPLQTIDSVPTATLEKMLVDIVCNTVLFGAQQGAEMENIYKSAYEKYIVDEARLLRYASRRKRKDVVQDLIKPFSKKRH